MIDKLITKKDLKILQERIKQSTKARLNEDLENNDQLSSPTAPPTTPDQYPGTTPIDSTIEPGVGDNTVNTVSSFEIDSNSIEPILETELNSQIVTLFNERIGDEYTAHYFYTCASNWCYNKGFNKAAAFFEHEATQELQHAKKLQKYMVDWNVVPTIPQVNTIHEVQSLVDIINKAYKLEYDLYKKYDENSRMVSQIDLAAFDFLQEFRNIQNESVIEYADLLNKLKLIDYTDKLSMVIFEQENFGE